MTTHTAAGVMSWAALMQTHDLARLDAQVLLAHVSGHRREWLLAHADEPAPTHTAQAFHTLAKRRRRGEPLAYLVGTREFYGHRFAVNSAVLIPRPETELLVEATLERLPTPPSAPRVLELGTGSGALAVTLALARPDAAVWATDHCPAALAVAQHNAQALGATAIQWAQGDWWQALPPKTLPFDVIVANPPYLAESDPHLTSPALQHEPRSALVSGHDGLDALRILIADAPSHLRPGGWLLLEHGYDQGAAVRALFLRQGWQNVATLVDLPGRDRVTRAQRSLF